MEPTNLEVRFIGAHGERKPVRIVNQPFHNFFLQKARVFLQRRTKAVKQRRRLHKGKHIRYITKDIMAIRFALTSRCAPLIHSVNK